MNTPVSRQILESTPDRVLTFLRAVGTAPAIRSLLASAGYTTEEHDHAWDLLHRLAGYRQPLPAGIVESPARQAIAELDAWAPRGFRRIRAALTRLHPEQAFFVLDGLEPGDGAASVLAVATLLARLEHLESSESPADRAATATLEARGITRAERERLRAVVALAQSAPELPPPPPEPPPSEDLLALRAWFEDWSETARAVVVRRDHLIRLGLARRRRSASSSPSAPSAPSAPSFQAPASAPPPAPAEPAVAPFPVA